MGVLWWVGRERWACCGGQGWSEQLTCCGGWGESDGRAVVPVAALCFAHAQEVGGTPPPTQIAVQFTYVLNYWAVSDWEQPMVENGWPPPPCPFGAATDPVE